MNPIMQFFDERSDDIVVEKIDQLAWFITTTTIGPSVERDEALRKLLEAKDCVKRARRFDSTYSRET